MNLNELKQKVKAEYDSRNLKSNARYNALDKIMTFCEGVMISHNISDIEQLLPSDKVDMKTAYAEYKGGKINDAESSVINEIYNQCRH